MLDDLRMAVFGAAHEAVRMRRVDAYGLGKSIWRD